MQRPAPGGASGPAARHGADFPRSATPALVEQWVPGHCSSSPMSAAIPVRHDPQASRFEARVDGLVARCDYRLQDGVMMLFHTEVPPALEGRGIGAALVRAALEHAAGQALRVRPRCSFVSAYLARHPEHSGLLG